MVYTVFLAGDINFILSLYIKVLLKECEEARGGVASTTHDTSHDLSSDNISSSSHVISAHLVEFRNIEELQEQNQKLLAVVRELSEERERQEAETVDEQTRVRRPRPQALSVSLPLPGAWERGCYYKCCMDTIQPSLL